MKQNKKSKVEEHYRQVQNGHFLCPKCGKVFYMREDVIISCRKDDEECSDETTR
jgi:predicted RNA-binding Zn-ribbon protein involved in translation (DUF1610 family)